MDPLGRQKTSAEIVEDREAARTLRAWATKLGLAGEDEAALAMFNASWTAESAEEYLREMTVH